MAPAAGRLDDPARPNIHREYSMSTRTHDDMIAQPIVRQALSQAFTQVGNALAQQRPRVRTGTVCKVFEQAVRAALESGGGALKFL